MFSSEMFFYHSLCRSLSDFKRFFFFQQAGLLLTQEQSEPAAGNPSSFFARKRCS